MKLTKIKYDGVEVYLEYFITNPSKKKEYFTIKSTDKPVQEFKDALQNLKNYFEPICELPEGYSKTIEIRGVSLSYGGPNETLGATITGLKTLKNSNAPLVINTPHLPAEDYNEQENDKVLPLGCADDISDLMEYAIKFIDGERDMTGTNESLFEGTFKVLNN